MHLVLANIWKVIRGSQALTLVLHFVSSRRRSSYGRATKQEVTGLICIEASGFQQTDTCSPIQSSMPQAEGLLTEVSRTVSVH